MAQVTVYLPADVLEVARKCAGRENRSLSAWVSALIREATATEWPASLVELLHHGSGDLVEPDDPPPEDVDAFRSHVLVTRNVGEFLRVSGLEVETW